MQEVRDPLILTGFLLATVLNAVLAAQMAWYWRASSKGASSSEKGPTGMGARTRSQSPGPARRMKRE